MQNNTDRGNQENNDGHNTKQTTKYQNYFTSGMQHIMLYLGEVMLESCIIHLSYIPQMVYRHRPFDLALVQYREVHH